MLCFLLFPAFILTTLEMVLRRQLVFAAALALVRAATITVPYNDPSIEFSGSGWGPDVFEIRPGIDPDNGGGALDSTCKLGDNSTTTRAFGNNFHFSFKGASVSLVLETRADHGQYSIELDGVTVAKKSGYSDAPLCGVVWTSDTLDGRKTHDLVVTYVARDERSPWPNNYLQLFKILYDDGPGKPPSMSTSTPANQQTDPPDTKPGSPAPVGAIVGGVVGGLAVIALIAVLFLLLRRRRRASKRNSSAYPAFVEANPLTTPTPYDPSQFSRLDPTPAQRARSEKETLTAPATVAAGSTSPGPSHSQTASQSGALSQPDVERIAQRLATLVQPPRYEA